ncbi:MAG: hypothetical protein ACYSWW_18110 [Planctomycetota bacterium]|jgi:hypothetical protein
MARQERAIFNNWDNSNDFWQYRCNQTQSPSQRPPQQTSAKTDGRPWVTALTLRAQE